MLKDTGRKPARLVPKGDARYSPWLAAVRLAPQETFGILWGFSPQEAVR